MTEVNRGEIWWAEDPRSGRRPVLVITRQTAIPLLTRVLCVPATRTIRGAPSELILDEDDGMPAECVLSFDNIRVLPKSALTERICRLNPERLNEVCPTLMRAVGC